MPPKKQERRASITDAILEGLNEEFFDEFAAEDFDAQRWADQVRGVVRGFPHCAANNSAFSTPCPA